jgi:hypothetical protein
MLNVSFLAGTIIAQETSTKHKMERTTYRTQSLAMWLSMTKPRASSVILLEKNCKGQNLIDLNHHEKRRVEIDL